jgi:hypothetical protein
MELIKAVVTTGMEIAKAINNVALEVYYLRKQMEKLDRTVSKLNEIPVEVDGKPSQE